eukprot:scaffold2532_cov112-Skeletonema_marinoi.AAC.1
MLIGYVTDEGLKTVTLDNMIISPEKKSLSTAQALMQSIDGGDELIEQGYEERDQNEMKGQGSKFGEWQRTSMPTINATFKNFRIEFLFNVSYDHSHDEESDLVWMSGEVIEIMNTKKNK